MSCFNNGMFLYQIVLGGKSNSCKGVKEILNNVIKRYFNIMSFPWMIQY